jgi:hypothetical protein
MALEAAVSLLAGKVADLFSDLRKEARASRVVVEDSALRASTLQHLRQLKSWSEKISLHSLIQDKTLVDCFAELTFATGLAPHGTPAAAGTALTVEEVYGTSSHVAILGGAGAGKSTSLQRVAQFAYAHWEQGRGGVPLLVRFRDLQDGESLVAWLLAEIGVYVDHPDGMPPRQAYRWKLRALIEALERISAVLLLDGLDELPLEVRLRVEIEIRDMAEGAAGVRLFLTCRTAEYKMPFTGVRAYTIAPLSTDQVAMFAVRWLGSADAPAFCDAVSAAPYAGTEVLPLMLAHLCALYEKHGCLPERPLEVYEQIVSLLVEMWDRQRGFQRQSRYAGFHPRKKERFLQAIAYELTQRGRRGTFHDHDLVAAYNAVAYSFELPRDSMREVVDELESHTGLVVRRGNSQFDFFHSTIQEYLAAMHAPHLPDPVSLLYPNCPNELALVVADSGNVTEYLHTLLTILLTSGGTPAIRDAFMKVFLYRLQAEHPAIRASPELGWTLLVLLSLTLHGREESGWYSESISAGIVRHPKIYNSMEMGLHPFYNPFVVPPEGKVHNTLRPMPVLSPGVERRKVEFVLEHLGFTAWHLDRPRLPASA